MELNAYLETEVTESEFNSFHRIPSRNHALLQTRIASILNVKYDDEYSILTAVDLELPTGKAVPDVAIFPKLLVDWNNDETRMTDPPITAIEIISPRQALTDLTDKNRTIYFPSGVRSVWIVLPTLKLVQVILPSGIVHSFQTGILKDPATGIEVSLAEIFK